MRRADSKKPSRRGRAGPDKDFLGKFKKQPVLLSAAICSPPAFSFVNKYHDAELLLSKCRKEGRVTVQKMIVNQLIRRVDVYRGYQINISFNFDLTPYIEGE